MSKPVLKKKRTILDFFTKSEDHGKSDQHHGKIMEISWNFVEEGKDTTDGPVSKKRKVMASCLSTGHIEAAGAPNHGFLYFTHQYYHDILSEPPAAHLTSDEVPDKAKSLKPKVKGDQPSTSATLPVNWETDSDGEEIEEVTEEDDSQKSDVSSASDRIPIKKPSQIKDGSNAWKGMPLNMLHKLENTTKDKHQIEGNKEGHRVLFKTPWKYDGKHPPKPYPTYKDKWDHTHVRLPCSNMNEYPCSDKNGKPIVRRRWDIIQEELLKDIPGPYELEERILMYNTRYFGKWKFTVLHDFFRHWVEEEERDHFFSKGIKDIARLALQLPHICTAPIPLLRERHNFSVTFSQQQIACLLANAFFCTFPRRNAKGKSEYSKFPNINFNTLFSGVPSEVKFEKIKCIIHYFRRVCKKMPCGTVTFTRQHIDSSKLPNWETDSSHLTALHVSSEGTIEDDGFGFLQADFANKFLGGGVLGHGCVQEEIRFLICPEMIISRLITECLTDEECLIMRGCERFSNYEGYASKFQWKNDYVDDTPRDNWGRMMCEVVAIDALVIHDYKSQFMPSKVKRELNKAYVGFYHHGKHKLPAVCTGNWGCGAFGGDKQLKAIIQIMAASKAGRELCYFTFDDERLRDDLFNIHKLLTDKNLDIGMTWRLLEFYNSNIVKHSSYRQDTSQSLFNFVIHYIQNFDISALKLVQTSNNMHHNSHHPRHYANSHNRHSWPHRPYSTELAGQVPGRNHYRSDTYSEKQLTPREIPNKNLTPRLNKNGDKNKTQEDSESLQDKSCEEAKENIDF